MTALARHLEERAVSLASRANDAMYQDPFWDARFGARGRAFAQQDGLHHIDYLVQALHFGSVEIIEDYARWLRTVLTTRGMCSLHIHDTYECLAEAIQALVPDPEPALSYLAAAQRALRYDTDPAREVQANTTSLAASAVEHLLSEQPSLQESLGPDAASRIDRDATVLLSYLVDCLALERPEVFSEHTRWAATFWDNQGFPPGYAAALVGALGSSLELCSAPTRDAAREILFSAAVHVEPVHHP
jgi:hypothetical protein